MRFASLERAGARGFYRLDSADRATPLGRPPWEAVEPAGPAVDWTVAELREPVAPTKIVCIGRNYAAHAKELGNAVPTEPLLFLKPPSSLIGHGGSIALPAVSARVEHEAELGVVIGRRARAVAAEAALDFVFGYTCVCDVTARDLQRKDVQFTRAKGFDTFCPVGPWIETELDVRDVGVRCLVGGELRQDGRTSQMLFAVPQLIAYVSSVMTLEPGDLLVTGTPEGVGPIARGEDVTVEIDGIGALSVRVS